jgi:hypothetical protein
MVRKLFAAAATAAAASFILAPVALADDGFSPPASDASGPNPLPDIWDWKWDWSHWDWSEHNPIDWDWNHDWKWDWSQHNPIDWDHKWDWDWHHEKICILTYHCNTDPELGATDAP